MSTNLVQVKQFRCWPLKTGGRIVRVTCSAERLIKLEATRHDAAKWQMFHHIILLLRHCVDAARDCNAPEVRVVIAMIAV